MDTAFKIGVGNNIGDEKEKIYCTRPFLSGMQSFFIFLVYLLNFWERKVLQVKKNLNVLCANVIEKRKSYYNFFRNSKVLQENAKIF